MSKLMFTKKHMMFWAKQQHSFARIFADKWLYLADKKIVEISELKCRSLDLQWPSFG